LGTLAGEVFINHEKAGLLEKTEGKYFFRYLKDYLDSPAACPISYSFPLREMPYESEELFPFFSGLVSEGWLLKMQSQAQKIDERDHFSLLLANGEDLIGAISIRPKDSK